MATHGRAGLERMMLGSVADTLIHEGKMPLLLFHPRNHRAAMTNPPHTIFVALDGSAFAERALAVAQYTARAVGARLLLVRVVVPAYSYALATPEVVAFGTYTDAMTLARTETRSYLEERERDARGTGLEAQSVMLEGDPAHELVRLASATPDSLVVMTTHGRAGIARTVLGSVADEVVRRAGSPVLLLRAADR
jgi:nucleotide-binding universal stress UspA family protein